MEKKKRIYLEDLGLILLLFVFQVSSFVVCKFVRESEKPKRKYTRKNKNDRTESEVIVG